jgi:hypothetical protein
MKNNININISKKWLAGLLSLMMVIMLNTQLASASTTAPVTPTTVDLLAGQSIDSGNVSVWNDSTNLYVKYETENGWLMNASHLAVAKTLSDIPQTSGKKAVAIPGKFDYSNNFIPSVSSHTYTISLESLNLAYNDTIFVAAHAVVEKLLADGSYQIETGWAAGNKFGGAWGSYFNYTIQEPETIITTTYTDAGSAWGNGTNFGPAIADYFVLDNFNSDKTTVLGLGKNEINTGFVIAHFDATSKKIDVTFSTMDPYFMNQAHLYIGGIAPTNTAPGSFANQYTVDEESEYFQLYTFTINLLNIDANQDGIADFDTNNDGIVDGNPIYIAAHAHLLIGSN